MLSERKAMKNTRKVAIAAIAVVALGVIGIVGLVVKQATSTTTRAGDPGARVSVVAERSGRSVDTRDNSRGAIVVEGAVTDPTAQMSELNGSHVSNSDASSSLQTDQSETASVVVDDVASVDGGSASSSGSDPAPVGDRAEWGPVTPVGPGEIAPVLSGGPTITSPSWSCGTKVILTVTVSDPNGVARVWGSYYIGGSKQGFTSSNPSGNVWSTTILNGDELPITGLVVYAKDGVGTNANLSLATICA